MYDSPEWRNTAPLIRLFDDARYQVNILLRSRDVSKVNDNP